MQPLLAPEQGEDEGEDEREVVVLLLPQQGGVEPEDEAEVEALGALGGGLTCLLARQRRNTAVRACSVLSSTW